MSAGTVDASAGRPDVLGPLPATFATTRESLRTLACYVISPARKAIDGHIGLRSVGDAIGTPVFADGSRIVVRGDTLRADGAVHPIGTLANAAAQLGLALVADPGVGHDLPPFVPEQPLAVHAAASFALAAWYAFGQSVIDRVAGDGSSTWTEAQLWPEHFDLASEVTVADGLEANVGFSAGDGYHADPYVYVGPHDMAGIDSGDGFWNAPFGAVLGYVDLIADADPPARAAAFVAGGLSRLTRSPS